MNKSVTILNLDTIELHYWLKDGVHTMSAHVFNKCEYEFLGIINELASALKLDIDVEVEPLGEGGIRAWFRIAKKNANAVKVGVLIFLLTEVICTPVTTTLEYVTTKVLETIFEDPEIKELEREKKKAELELDIAVIKAEIERQCANIDENKLKKKRSNYYEAVSKDKKVEKITILSTDASKNVEYGRRDVMATEFDKFIMTSDDLEPQCDENATIEIISPVLKKGKYQWLGIYNGTVIQFKMKSNEFKNMVLTGQVPFKNGSSIICLLLTSKKIDNQGNEKVTGYEVLEVYNYFENEAPIETPEGKRRRQKEEAERSQMSLFTEEDFR